jgi:hypothetical protein
MSPSGPGEVVSFAPAFTSFDNGIERLLADASRPLERVLGLPRTYRNPR